MSLNQIELNEIVQDNLNQYYAMCSLPPVQHHFVEWYQNHTVLQQRDEINVSIDNVTDAWNKVWAFKHWYMQKYFGDHVDALMKITLEPDAFRYYVLRYRNDEGRPARERNPEHGQDQPANIETSEPSSPENALKTSEPAQISTIFPDPGTLHPNVVCTHPNLETMGSLKNPKWCPDCQHWINPDPNTSEQPTVFDSLEKPIFMPGAKIGDPPGFTWCMNESFWGERCKRICDLCIGKHSAKTTDARNDEEGSAADHQGARSDQTGFFCINEENAGPINRCIIQCLTCRNLPSPDEIKSSVEDFFNNYKPGTDEKK